MKKGKNKNQGKLSLQEKFTHFHPEGQNSIVYKRIINMTQELEQYQKKESLNSSNYCFGTFHFTDIKQPDKQVLSQEQMREMCNEIRENVRLGRAGNFEIDFVEFTLKFGWDTYYLSDSALILRGMGSQKSIGCVFPENNRFDARILIRSKNETKSAFLETGFIDGTTEYSEIVEVSLFSTFNVEDENMGFYLVHIKELNVIDVDVLPGYGEYYRYRSDIPESAKPPKFRGDYIILGDMDIETYNRLLSEGIEPDDGMEIETPTYDFVRKCLAR
jgi:hypothetical protein